MHNLYLMTYFGVRWKPTFLARTAAARRLYPLRSSSLGDAMRGRHDIRRSGDDTPSGGVVDDAATGACIPLVALLLGLRSIGSVMCAVLAASGGRAAGQLHTYNNWMASFWSVEMGTYGGSTALLVCHG